MKMVSLVHNCKLMKKVFKLISPNDVDRNIAYTCDPIHGTQKLHFMCALRVQPCY